MDLSTLDTVTGSDAGAEIELKHPGTGEPLGIFVTVYGRDSQAFKNQVRQSINARVKKRKEMTPEEAESDGIALLAACTKSWREGGKDSLTFKGEELYFSVENASKVYAALPWIRRQVDDSIADLSNFLTV